MTAVAARKFVVDRRGWAGAMRDAFVGVAEVASKKMQVVQTASRSTQADWSAQPTDLTWLSKAYSLIAMEAVDPAVDLVFDNFDALLHAGKFRKCDELLAAVDVKRLDTNLMVAFLTITEPAKAQLKRRAELVRRIENQLAKTAPRRVAELLDGLR
jgi:hypothetical protein